MHLTVLAICQKAKLLFKELGFKVTYSQAFTPVTVGVTDAPFSGFSSPQTQTLEKEKVTTTLSVTQLAYLRGRIPNTSLLNTQR